MAEPVTSFIIANDKEFLSAIDRLSKTTSDFRIPFGLIAKDFYRSNRKIFTLKSAGLYQDLAPASGDINTTSNYKARKQREVGFTYPILVKEGELAASLVSPQGAGAELFIGRNELIMGTSVDHAKYHQSDEPRTKIPQRKVVFIDGGPAEKARDASIAGRRERWTNIVFDYERQLLTGSAK